MSSRRRSEIFEVVVLKEKKDKEKCTPPQSTEFPRREGSIEGSSHDTRGVMGGPERGNSITDGPEEVSTAGGDESTKSGFINSFDNVIYSSTYVGSSQKEGTKHTLMGKKWLFFVFSIILLSVVLMGICDIIIIWVWSFSQELSGLLV